MRITEADCRDGAIALGALLVGIVAAAIAAGHPRQADESTARSVARIALGESAAWHHRRSLNIGAAGLLGVLGAQLATWLLHAIAGAGTRWHWLSELLLPSAGWAQIVAIVAFGACSVALVYGALVLGAHRRNSSPTCGSALAIASALPALGGALGGVGVIAFSMDGPTALVHVFAAHLFMLGAIGHFAVLAAKLRWPMVPVVALMATATAVLALGVLGIGDDLVAAWTSLGSDSEGMRRLETLAAVALMATARMFVKQMTQVAHEERRVVGARTSGDPLSGRRAA